MKRTLAAVLICAVLTGIFCVPISASSGSLVSMEVVKGPDKSEYIVGEYIDLRGTVVKLTYDNGDDNVNISDLFELKGLLCG